MRTTLDHLHLHMPHHTSKWWVGHATVAVLATVALLYAAGVLLAAGLAILL